MSGKGSHAFHKFLNIWNNFLSVLGVSSIIPYQTQDGEWSYKISAIRLISPIVIISLLIYLLYFQIARTTFDLYNIGNTVMDGYLNLTGNVVTALSLLSALLNSNAYAKMKHGYLRFSKVLKFEPTRLIYLSLKIWAVFSCVYFISLIIDILLFDFKSELDTLKFVTVYIFEFYNFLGICHFSICCFWLKQAFSTINESVEEHLRDLKAEDKFDFESFGKEFLKKNSVFPYEISPWPKAVGENGEIHKESKTKIETVKKLRASYHDVYNLSLDVNKVFSTRNLLTVGHNFLLGTIYIYCGINELVKFTADSSKIDSNELLNYFKWSAISFFCVYGLIWPSNTTSTEAQRTSALIQELLTKAKNLELRNELHSFALQFTHEKVAFSPHGFFTLNNQLFLSIVGAVASYLVVLIQFRISMK